MTKPKGPGQGRGLRIVAGSAKGRRLRIPPGEEVRPTLDRIRESLFNILAGDLINRVVLDLFAGSGALGIEALSRGAEFALFADSRPVCTRTIQENLEQCRLMGKAKVIQADIPSDFFKLKKAEDRQYDLVFLDPPYTLWDKEKLLEQLNQFYLLRDDARIVFEHFHKDAFHALPPGFDMEEQRRYGDTVLSFLRLTSWEPDRK